MHGVRENEAENTDDLALDIIKNELGLVDFSVDKIQRSHRLGPRKSQPKHRNTRSTYSTTNLKQRPIILRITSYRHRQKVFRVKSKLKGKRMTITENLTQHRCSILQAAIEIYGKGKVWSINGRITRKENDRYITINNMDDLL